MKAKEGTLDEIMITPGAARVLLAMIASCGNSGCLVATRLLSKVIKDVSLRSVGMDEDGNWRMGAFSRLKDFAVTNRLWVLDTFDVAHYFGGGMHIEIFRRFPDAGLGRYLGADVGLVSHVLLPLTGEVYRNGGHAIDFAGHFVPYNQGDTGVPCYHLGVVSNILLTAEQVETILTEQRSSKPFISSLSKIKGPIDPPLEYWEALSCTIKAARG